MKKRRKRIKNGTLKAQKVPLRTCIGCRQVKPQGELLRLFVDKSGKIQLNMEKRESGRGAYLCPRKECWEKGLKKDRLEYTLKTKVALEDIEQVRERALYLKILNSK